MINRQSSNGYIPSNDREQQNYLGGYGLSFRNIEEHKYIGKRVYTIERMILNIWNTNSRRIVQIADYPQDLSRQGQMFPDTCEHM